MSRRTGVRAPNPQQPPPVSIATRRDLFGTMGALLLLTAAEAGQAKAAELDGELIACCTEALWIDTESRRLWTIWLATPEIVGVQQPEQIAYDAHEAATLDRWHELVDHVCTLPARTPEGLRDKIAVARSAYPAERRDDPDPCDRLALAAFADVLAGGAA